MIALAALARSMSDDALVGALHARGVPTTGMRDLFDLAEWLLTPTSVQAALGDFDRTHLAVLGATTTIIAETGAEPGTPVGYDDVAARLTQLRTEPITVDEVRAVAAQLAAVLLCRADDDGIAVFRGVAERLAEWPAEGLPSFAELAAPFPPTPVAESDVDTRMLDALAAERAFSTVAAIAELVTAVGTEPARELGKGGLSLPDAKRLATAMSIPIEQVAGHLRVAARAALAALNGTDWMQTDTGGDWLNGSTPERWAALASSWYEAMPTDVHDILASARVPWGPGIRAYVAWLYPASGAGLEGRIDEFSADAELLGITAGSTPGAVGALVLRGELTAAVETLDGLLPHEVDRVYLQHDLTVISPGPLAPRLDARLRTLADVESRELASSYRVTASSVERALAVGETAESMLAFLGEISLTGMPQPLGYLISETAARYGRVRVGATHGEEQFRSYVRSDDESLIGQISVDKTLTALALVRTGTHRVASRFEPSIVFWALSDARYPVAAENDSEQIVHIARRTVRRPAPPAKADPLVDLVVRLRAADADMGETGLAFLARQIEAAIREKRTLTVSVRMPGGTVSDYLLEPTSVANGRMRARDRRADIERTLPLSSIDGIS
ncbi:helicase-associated domain-containing protein [Leifsonia sp. YIM 134122]|uniref:Helicase-associated domain-containing protein n=1 Tax=Leifsonia stereocauli TaxID=3134136 RepID=A0ABU9W175_9MICO